MNKLKHFGNNLYGKFVRVDEDMDTAITEIPPIRKVK